MQLKYAVFVHVIVIGTKLRKKTVLQNSILNRLGVADYGYDRTTGSNMATFSFLQLAAFKRR